MTPQSPAFPHSANHLPLSYHWPFSLTAYTCTYISLNMCKHRATYSYTFTCTYMQSHWNDSKVIYIQLDVYYLWVLEHMQNSKLGDIQSHYICRSPSLLFCMCSRTYNDTILYKAHNLIILTKNIWKEWKSLFVDVHNNLNICKMKIIQIA